MTDIAMQPLEVSPHRLNTIRLALIALAVAALIVASFAVGRVTGPSHSSNTNSGTGNSVPAVVAPGLHDVQQPALVCHLHGPC